MRRFDKQQPSSTPTLIEKPEFTPKQDISCTRDLRYILTQDCNYHCGFCHKERMDGNEKPLFDAKDYGFMYETACDVISLQWVTLTGGEPLIRKDIYEILTELKCKEAFVTMVTNGSLLAKKSAVLPLIDRLNISLHSTNQALYESITGSHTNVQHLMNDIRGIKKQFPDIDLRLNATLVEWTTAEPHELRSMINFVKDNSLTIKYLELSPRWAEWFVPTSSIIPFLLQEWFVATPTKKGETIYTFGNAKVILRTLMCSLVQDHGLSQEYCKQNADINVSPDGLISPCIYDQKKIWMYELVKSRDRKQLADFFVRATNDSTTYNCCVK